MLIYTRARCLIDERIVPLDTVLELADLFRDNFAVWRVLEPKYIKGLIQGKFFTLRDLLDLNMDQKDV